MGPYRIYVDNWYGSLELGEDLQKKGVYFTRGCRSNRPSFLFADGLHQELDNHYELKEFACWIHRDNNIGSISWKDKSLVNFISNQHYNNVDKVD